MGPVGILIYGFEYTELLKIIKQNGNVFCTIILEVSTLWKSTFWHFLEKMGVEQSWQSMLENGGDQQTITWTSGEIKTMGIHDRWKRMEIQHGGI